MSGPSPSQFGPSQFGPNPYDGGAPNPGGPGPYGPYPGQPQGRPQPPQGYQSPQHSQAPHHGAHERRGLNTESSYPGTLPPPVDYPTRRRWPIVVGAVAGAALLASGVVIGLLLGRSTGEEPITTDEARAALQDYVDALASGDTAQVSRHTLCGLYDAVKDHTIDEQVAKINSEAFRQGFEKVDVVSVDKMVFASPGAAQALFTVQVTPAQQGSQREDQGVAQILRDGDEILVCSYLLRNANY